MTFQGITAIVNANDSAEQQQLLVLRERLPCVQSPFAASYCGTTTPSPSPKEKFARRARKLHEASPRPCEVSIAAGVPSHQTPILVPVVDQDGNIDRSLRPGEAARSPGKVDLQHNMRIDYGAASPDAVDYLEELSPAAIDVGIARNNGTAFRNCAGVDVLHRVSAYPSSVSLFEAVVPRKAMSDEEVAARQLAPLERPLSVPSNLWASDSNPDLSLPISPCPEAEEFSSPPG